jgi:outer membrane protein TolC
MAQAQLTRREAEHTRDTAQGTLAHAMGLEPNVAFTLALPVSHGEMDEADAALEKNVTPLLALARKRPDVAAAYASYRQAEAGVRSAKSAGLPSLNATASYGGNRALMGGDRSTSAAAGLTLSIPLFTGFNRHYQITAAERAADAAKASADAALNNALLDVWTAHATLKSARDTRMMTRTLLESATQAEKLALGRYKAGVGTITELLSAESQLSSARQQAVSADSNVSIARADLLRAMGALSPDTLAFVEK